MKPIYAAGVLLLLTAACGPSAEEKAKAQLKLSEAEFEMAMQDSAFTDPTPYLISEHELKGNCAHVNHSVEKLEQYTRLHNGYVEHSNLNAVTTQENEVQSARDSVTRVQTYHEEAMLTLRIPFYLLDSLMQMAAAEMNFISYRGLSNEHAEKKMIQGWMQEATLEEASNVSKEDAAALRIKPLALNEHNQQQLQIKQNANRARYENLALKESMMYATLHVSLKGNEQYLSTVNWLPGEIKPYEPGFAEKLWISAASGIDTLKNIILWLVKNWVWWLLLFALVKLYRKVMLSKTVHVPSV